MPEGGRSQRTVASWVLLMCGALGTGIVHADQIVYDYRSTQLDFELDLATLTWHGKERRIEQLRVTGPRGLETAGTFPVFHGDLVSIESAKAQLRHPEESNNWLDVELISQDVSPDAGSHSDAKARLYLIRGVRIGDEVRVEFITHHKRAWEIPAHVFGGADSVREEHFEVNLPRAIVVDPRIVQGGLRWPPPQMSHSVHGGKQKLQFVARGLPARPRIDEYCPPSVDLQPVVRIGALEAVRSRGDTLDIRSTWSRFAIWYDGRVAPMLALDKPTEIWANNVVGASPSRSARIESLFRAVQTQVRYMAIEVGEGGWIPHPAPVTRARGYGDCKDMASLLVAGLRQAGVEAYPALVCTRGAGTVDATLPFSMQFNHCVAYVPDPDGDWWLDATDPDIPAGEVSHFIDANPALVLAGSATRFMKPAPRDAAASEFFKDYRLAADASGRANVEFEFEWRGAAAAEARGHLRRLDEPGRLALARTLVECEFLAVTDLVLRPRSARDSRLMLAGTCLASSPFAERRGKIAFPRGVTRIHLPDVQPARAMPFVTGPRTRDRTRLTARPPAALAPGDTLLAAQSGGAFVQLDIGIQWRAGVLECNRVLQWEDGEVASVEIPAFVECLGKLRHLNDDPVVLPGRRP